MNTSPDNKYDLSCVSKETITAVFQKIIEGKVVVDCLIVIKVMSHHLCANDPERIYRNIEVASLLDGNISLEDLRVTNYIWDNLNVAYEITQKSEIVSIDVAEGINDMIDQLINLDKPELLIDSEEIRKILLLIFCHFSHSGNFITFCPYWNQVGTSCMQYLNGICDIIILYFWLLEKICLRYGIPKSIPHKSMLHWQFDNKDNPIEQKLIEHMKLITTNTVHRYYQEYSDALRQIYAYKPYDVVNPYARISTDICSVEPQYYTHAFTFETLSDVLDMTFDYDAYLSKMDKDYDFAVINDTYSSSTKGPCYFIWAYILLQMITTNPLMEYL